MTRTAAFLSIERVFGVPVTADLGNFLLRFARNRGEESTWWAHVEQSDGYVVGRWAPGDSHLRLDGSTKLDGNKIVDARLFSCAGELRLGRAGAGQALSGWFAETAEETPRYPDKLRAHLEPRVRFQLLGGPDATATNRDRFTTVKRGNGQTAILPELWPSDQNQELVLSVVQYYSADLATGLVRVEHVSARGYEVRSVQ